jgi:hypothetical protein
MLFTRPRRAAGNLAYTSLQERWDHSSPLSPDEQRAALFAEFVRMGIHGRYVSSRRLIVIILLSFAFTTVTLY